MEREKPNFDILGRIDRERLARGWSEYTLAENSGLTQSTLSTWRRRNLQPNVTSIEKICHGLGSRVPIKQYLQKFPQWGRFGVTSVTPFLLLPVHPEGYTPAHHT